MSKPANLDKSDNVIPDVITTTPQPENEFVRIPKSEYEEIKSRVSAIENRISQELSNVQVATSSSNVQSVYEKTLEEVGGLNSPGTDQLARRLSKELKIRRSAEHKIIRSPSARKIGSIRRRSQEITKLSRNQSCHIPRVTLKRGRPNTVMTGLPHPSPVKYNDVCRASSFHCHQPLEEWSNAESFFKNKQKHVLHHGSIGNNENRDSLAKLRSQNAGMVLAKAKLFDNISDNSDNVDKSLERKRVVRKGGMFPRQNPNLRRAKELTDDKENEVIQNNGTVINRSKIRSPRMKQTTPLRMTRQ